MLLFSGCAPAPVDPPKSDVTQEAWYTEAVDQLRNYRKDAGELIARGKADDAAILITKGQPVINRVLGVNRPTLAAMEAASDLDQLYGQMLLRNQHYGWARMLFQKNLARWKNWKPQTDETARRRKLAESGIAECDRGLVRQP